MLSGASSHSTYTSDNIARLIDRCWRGDSPRRVVVDGGSDGTGAIGTAYGDDPRRRQNERKVGLGTASSPDPVGARSEYASSLKG